MLQYSDRASEGLGLGPGRSPPKYPQPSGEAMQASALRV